MLDMNRRLAATAATVALLLAGCATADDEAGLYRVDTERAMYVDGARDVIEATFDTPDLLAQLCADEGAAAALSDGWEEAGMTVDVVQDAIDQVCG